MALKDEAPARPPAPAPAPTTAKPEPSDERALEIFTLPTPSAPHARLLESYV